MKPFKIIFRVGDSVYFNAFEMYQVPPIGATITMSGEGEVNHRYEVVGHNWYIELKSDFSRVVIGVDEVYVHLKEIK